MHSPRRLPPRRVPACRWVGLVLVALALAACGGDDGGLATSTGRSDAEVEPIDADLPLVVATTSILGDVVANVVGDAAEVVVLMPAGVDPHGYQPSSADAVTLRDADLVVSVGLGLEEQLVGAIAAAEEEGARTLEVAEHLDPLAFGSDEHHDHEGEVHSADDGHDHGPLDPHVWLDPVRMAEAAELIGAELDAVTDGGFEARAGDYAAEVLAVHAELEERFADLPATSRQLVTNHDALGYLAHRYDLEVLGTVIPGVSSQAEPDARAFADLVATIEDAGVTAIFTEQIERTGLADQLAREVAARGGPDVEVVPLFTDTLGEPGSGADTYLGLLRENGRRIVEALR